MRFIALVSVFAIAFILPSAVVHFANAANICTSTGGGGNWNAAATWTGCGGTIPQNGDSAVITSGNPVTVNANTNAILSVNVQSGAVVDFSGGFTLKVQGAGAALTVDGTINDTSGTGIVQMNTNPSTMTGSGTINSAVTISQITSVLSGANLTVNGTITMANNFTIDSGATLHAALINSNGRTVTNNGTVNLTGNYARTGGTAIWTQGTNAVLNIGGIFTPTANITLNASAAGNTINYNGAAQNLQPTTYVNLTLSGSGAKTFITGAFTVNGILSMQGTATTTLTGTLTAGAASTLEYKGSAAQVTGSEFISPWPGSGGVKIENASGVTLNAAKSVGANPFTIGGTVSNSVFSDGGFQLTATGTLNLTSGTLKLGSAGTATVWPSFGTRNISAGTTVEYAAGVAQVVSITPSYQNLTFSGAGAKTPAAGTLSVAGNWSTSGGTATLNTNNNPVNVTGNITGTGNITVGSGAITIGGDWTNNGTLTPGTGTVTYNGAGAQIVGGVTYNNLTLAGSGVKTAGSDAAVNGVLTLTNNLSMSTFTLTMGGSATTVGAGDVTGIVKRTTFVAGTAYTFGNQFTTITLQSGGTMPSQISLKINIGAAPGWKTDAILRKYALIQTGASSKYGTVQLHYLDGELNGNIENELVYWRGTAPFTPGTGIEFGRSNYNTTDNWVAGASVPIHALPTSFGVAEATLANSALTNATWDGSADTNWLNPDNWTPTGIPSDLSDVVIPDASTTPNDPLLATDFSVSVGRMTIQSGGIINTSGNSTITVSGAAGAWSNMGGTFNPGTGTVIFTGALATISGTTDFHNVTINAGAGATMASGSMMRIDGTMTNNGTWPAAGLTNATIEYNGGAQTVLNPNGVTPGYDNLILSGSGVKTMPVAALTIGGNFTMAGTATATAGNAINTAGNFTIGSGNTFTTGAFTHTIGGNFTNDGIFTATGSTITLDGTVAQAIGGTTATVFNNLSVTNTAATVTATNNFSVTGTMTVNSGTTFDAATSVVSGAGTFTLASGGTLGIGSPNGITSAGASGNIQTTTRNFNTGATYMYTGTVNQASGNGLPSAVNGLTVNNTGIAGNNTVTLGGTKTVNETLLLVDGYFATGANNIYISSTGIVSGGSTGSHVVGNLKKYIATGATSKTFEIGDGTVYAPVDIAFGSVTGANDLTATTAAGDCANIGSSTIDAGQSVNRCWTLTNAGIVFDTYSGTFHFASGDVDPLADPMTFIVGRYASGWTYPTVGTRTATSTQATGLLSFSDFQLGELANTAPNVPVLVSPTNGSYTNDSTPTLSAHYSDPDVGDVGTTNYRISSTSLNNCINNINIVAFGTSATTASENEDTTWTPGSSIGGNATYYWCAQNNDGVLTSSWTSMGTFILDTSIPTVTTVSSTLANGEYKAGQVVPITVTFSEAVTVTGTPQLTLATGSPATTAVDYSSGSGTNILTFNYTVSAGNTSADLDYATTGSLALNGGTINDAAANPATLTLSTPGTAGSLGFNKNIIIDTTVPVLAEVTPVTSPTTDNTPDYTFSSTEAGTLTYGGDCSSIDITGVVGSNTVTFDTPVTHAVLADGTYANCTMTITDAAGNDSNILNVSSFNVDASSPIVIGVSSSAPNGYYKVGTLVPIPITVTFSENVDVNTVGGTPYLRLVTGNPAITNVAYSSGTGTDTLTFDYTVVTGNASADLDYFSTASLVLNGGTIKDTTGNDALLTLATPGAVGSLGNSKNIIIDTDAPAAPTQPDLAAADDQGTSNTDNITYQTTLLTFSGTAEADSTVELFVGAGSQGTVTATGGNWTFDITLLAGTYSITATATDAAGNTYDVSTPLNVTVDTTAPTVSSVAWNDLDISTNISALDTVVVTFSETIDSATITTANIDARLGLSNAHTFGTTGNGMALAWSGFDSVLTITLGTDMTVVSGDTIDPTASVTDIAGNADATAAPVAILDNISPVLTTITWTDVDSSTTFSGTDTIAVAFSEPMNTATITNVNVNTATGLSNLHTFGTTGNGMSTSWNGLGTILTITLGSDTTVVGGDTLDPTASVTDVAGNPDATPAPMAIIDAVSPYVTSVVWNDLDVNTYISANDSVVVVFSESMDNSTISLGNVDSRLGLSSGHTFAASSISWNGSNTALTVNLGVGTTVVSGDTIDPTASVTDAVGNPDATPATVAILDNVSPVVTNVTSSTANGAYPISTVIPIQVTFSEPVYVTGTPQITLETGGTDEIVDYSSGSGTTTLTFDYTVVLNDLTWDLDYIGTTALALNGGTIDDGAANPAVLTLPAPGTAGSLGYNKNLLIDAIPHLVTNITSSTLDGSYGAGSVISIQVIFNEDAFVTGSPRLLLETGATDRYATYVSGSGTDSLTFEYTVVAGDVSSDLDYFATNSLELNSGTIKDPENLDFPLTLPVPGAAGSLGANKAIVIDTAAPAAPSTPDLAAADDTGFSTVDDLTRNTSALTFSGTAEANSVVEIFDGLISAGTTITGGGGNWTIDISLTAGVHSISATATDAANNVSGSSGILTVTVDTTLPTVLSIDSDGQTYNLSTSSPQTITITLDEDAYVNPTVSVSPDGGAQTVGDCGDVDAATYCFDYAIPLAVDDTETITVSGARDMAGNTMTADSGHMFVVDTISPTVTIDLDNYALKSGDTAQVTFTFNEIPVGFTIADVTVVENGGLTGFAVTGDPKVYTATFIPNAGIEDTLNLITVGTGWTDPELNPPASSTDSLNYEIDTLSPSIIAAEIQDVNQDGRIDRMVLTFNENLADTAAGANGLNVTSASDHGTCADELSDPDVSTTLVVNFSCGTANTAVGDITLQLTANAGLVDAAGNEVSSVVLTGSSSPAITDAADPVIMTTSPVDGAVDVLRNAKVIVTFSEPMTTGSVTKTSAPDPGSWSEVWSLGNTVATYSHALFAATTPYTFTVTGGDSAAAGDSSLVSGPVVNPFAFTTGIGGSGGGGGGGGGSVIPTAVYVNINDNAATTNTTAVTVNMLVNYCAEMMISNNSSFIGAAWESCANTKAWTLTGGAGMKTVYVKFRNSSGTESTIYSDSIELVSPAPVEPGNPIGYTPTPNTIESWLDGRWVKLVDGKAVYYIDVHNVRHAYPNQAVWESYFGTDFSRVSIISANDLAAIPLGRNVPFNIGILFKMPSVTKVYVVDGDFTIRWIMTEALAEKYFGYNWAAQVKDLSEAFFSDYVVGASITE